MTKSIIILTIVFTIYACSGNEKTKTETAVPNPENAAMNNPDYDAGLALVAKSDCFTCHKLREVATGPSYGAVAQKYDNTPENVSMLAQKIIKGGTGNWGQVPMTAHPNIPVADAEMMIKYILLLRQQK